MTATMIIFFMWTGKNCHNHRCRHCYRLRSGFWGIVVACCALYSHIFILRESCDQSGLLSPLISIAQLSLPAARPILRPRITGIR